MARVRHPFDASEVINAKEAKEIHDELLAEADAIVKAGEREPLSNEQQARWTELMDEDDGLIGRAERAHRAAKEYDDQRKELALKLRRSSEGMGFGDSVDPSNALANPKAKAPIFRCMHTGQIIQAVDRNQRLAQSASDSLYGSEERRAGIGAVLASILTGRNDFATPGQIQAAITGNDSGGGYLVDTEMSTQIIDLARSASVAMRAGAMTVPMQSSELVVGRLTGDPTGQWRPEASEVRASDVSFDRVVLRPKTLAAVVPISIELLEDAANAASIIEDALKSALGKELDKAILIGSGSESTPRGIAHFADVNTVSAVGTPADYSKITSAIGKIHNANFDGDTDSLAWILHPRDAETFDGLTDTTGQPLNPTPWASKLQRLATTSLPNNEGGGSNESISLIGDFSQCIVGTRTSGVVVRILDSGQVTDSDGNVHNAASQLKKLIVAHLRADVALLRPTWFSLLEGITAT